MIFDFEKNEEMTSKQASIIIAVILACAVVLWLVDNFNF